jgi:hypothetical protein
MLRMSGALLLLLLYAFMAWTDTTLPFLRPFFLVDEVEKDSHILLNTVIFQGQKVQDGSVSNWCSVPSSGQRFYSLQPPPHCLCGPLNLQSNGWLGIFPHG